LERRVFEDPSQHGRDNVPLMSFWNDYYIPADPEHIKRERRKAQELRQGSWWSQQIGPGLCHHCGGKFPKEKLTMDHLVPIARGGKSSKSNCVPCCKECNNQKGAKLV
jgi:5-methylcytosine-specific restriction protein A